ncbi:11797_t:CDS:2, partial [Racocetra fulgida]
MVTYSTGYLEHVTGKDVLNVIKIQWRSSLLAMILLEHQLTNNGQNECAYIPKGHIPNIVFLTISELLTASV